MPKIALAFLDHKGQSHTSLEAATIADLNGVVGNPVLARTLMERRAEVEAIFKAHDEAKAEVQSSPYYRVPVAVEPVADTAEPTAVVEEPQQDAGADEPPAEVPDPQVGLPCPPCEAAEAA